ncbi:MAG: hypothetical protein D4R97_05910 [Bacteroidetes bacterium]|nr:MAG: hypothetical protein D4R97_05910 [Bacteroidota bacterium]
MKTKVILAVLATTVTGFFLGWLIFGFALADFYKTHTVFYQGLMKDPPTFLGFIIGNLSFGVLIVYIFDRWAKIGTFFNGLLAGMFIYFLISLSVDMFTYGSMHLFSRILLVVDVIAKTVLGGLVGGVAGLVLGLGKKETAG